MKKIVFLAFLLISASAFSDSNLVQFNNGWIKQLPPVVPMRAGYININNSSPTVKKIVALQSTAFEKVEIHETIMADGMMKMIELDSLELPAKSLVELKPGGKHMMLITPVQPLNIGDKVELLVTFEDESTQSVMLEVKK